EQDPAKQDPAEDGGSKGGGPKEDPAEDDGTEQQPDATPPDGRSGKEPFPCPEFDAEAYHNAAYERTPAALPDVPFHLKTSRLGLSGLKYHGIVLVRTHGGQEKRVLKFTAEELNIRDLHQYAPTSSGRVQHIRSRPGSTSTFRGGTVTMYTEELKGWLFGLIPITFSPKSPPPLDLPAAFFTSAEVRQAGQFGGNLTVPGLRLSLE
ncbi:hydrogenase expression protein HypF, partial [Streptomyces durbertensis]|nr:hydrogenase expression protein HypF [Streptomyces durbertensis]